MPNQIRNVTHNLLMKPIRLFTWLLLTVFLTACGGSSGSSSDNAGPFTVSGKLIMPGDADVDLDVNGQTDRNNDPNDPQILNNPLTLGGYLSGYAGQYASGTAFSADQVDYFSISLVQGQALLVSLFQADALLDQVDLTLTLRDTELEVVSELTMNTFSAASLTVPEDGLYILELRLSQSSDPLLYTLSLSQSLNAQSLSATGSETLKYDFIPGDILIRYQGLSRQTMAEQATVLTNNRHAPVSGAAEHIRSSLQQHFELIEEEQIPGIAQRYRVPDKSLAAAFSMQTETEQPSLKRLEKKLQTLAVIASLKTQAGIEFAEPNYLYRTAATTDDPRLNEQWNLAMLSVQAAWEASTGNGTRIAVLDTGIDASHEDLFAGVSSNGYDFISSTASSGDGDGFDANPNDEGSRFHGSHVAGIIVAEANNTKGIAGIAHQASLMPLRVLGIQDTGSISDIAQAILYAANLPNASGQTPGKPAHILNMSFGGEARSETLKTALDQAFEAGLILVAAAGNNASDRPFYPASFDNVIGVGAVSSEISRSGFSNFGPNVQVVAPGGTGPGNTTFDGFEDGVLSTINANNYRELAGTSMAAPHVAAVAALMKQLMPALNGETFNDAVLAGALTDRLSAQDSDPLNYYGNGLINAAKAVNWAAGSTVIPPTLSLYPMQFGFIGATTQRDLTLNNAGSGSVEITSISSSNPEWLSITPKDTDNKGLGRYQVQVGSTQAPIAQGEIQINYQTNNDALNDPVDLSARLKVFISRNNQTDASIGVVFVSLFKEDDILNDGVQPFQCQK